MKGRLFVWLGGAMFAGALADCAYHFLYVWGRVEPGIDLRPIVVNMLLFGVFAAHHSVFARERIKARLSALVPEHLLRSVYVWTASALLVAVCALWQRVGGEAYHVSQWPALAFAAVQLAGLGLIALSVGAINPLVLAGVHVQTTPDTLQTTGPYRWVRHPLYLGWILAAFGAAHMTGDRLAFGAISSIYLIVAVPWEERSLERSFGESYRDYTRRVKWRIIPFVY